MAETRKTLKALGIEQRSITKIAGRVMEGRADSCASSVEGRSGSVVSGVGEGSTGDEGGVEVYVPMKRASPYEVISERFVYRVREKERQKEIERERESE